MKEVDIELKITKENSYHKTGVTPMEALVLTVLHHRNVLDHTVIIADKAAVKEVTRTNDQELDRLRSKYGSRTVDAIRSKVEAFPTDFKEATERGLKIALSGGVQGGGFVAEHKL